MPKTPSDQDSKIQAEDTFNLNYANGLNSLEVQEKQKLYGRNEVAEKQASPIVAFAKKFWGLAAWMLEVAIVLSAVLGKYLDVYIIAALLLVNAVLGFIQEQQATRAVKALKQKLQLQARVLRDGVWQTVNATEIVSGDVVRVRSGDFVPADFKILDSEVTVDQSAITGESLPVEKNAGDVVYSGSLVKKGEVTGVITAIGVQTMYGKTAQLVQFAKPKLHMEGVISNLMKWLLVMVVSLLLVATAVSWARGLNLLDLLSLALVLLVAAIPVALPTMFTITMALGSYELAGKGVLVTRLSASEDAALMDVLCVDKTGTITENKLTIADTAEMGNYSKEDTLIFGQLASQMANQDPIDLAFFAAVDDKKIRFDEFKQTKFTPFDPSTRRTEAIVEKRGQTLRVAKGAVLSIIEVCQPTEDELAEIKNKTDAFAEKGYRVIAVAAGKESGKMDVVGLVALYDKPRPESAKLIAKLRSLGIAVKMLTGDSQPIATQIAKEVGLGEKITRMADVEKNAGNAVVAAEIVDEMDGFAEIYPEGKYRIVKGLQVENHVVGMTGDGINDAAALKQAEVGIAVSNATDVAKGSASVVLTEEGLSNVVDLVKTGRMIYQRILTWIFNKIVKTFQVILFVIVAFLLTGLFVVGAFQVVLLLFLVDFVTISLSTDNVTPSEKPESWNITPLVKGATLLGVATVIESLGLLYLGLNYLGLSNTAMLNTFSFDMLLFGGLFTIFVVRERSNFWKSKPSRPLLTAITADIIISSLISIIGIPGLTPIPPLYVAIALGWFFVFALLLNDQLKTHLLPHDSSKTKG
ncbi:MAG TPA: plasma-membrane proton-efflux P-type ATPase [Candidatus Bathyarchaeia archaeon]|nr:plasma-membrane proton-efflux P-type ATPase [Candidatus Bathyarchaeia archaeon]